MNRSLFQPRYALLAASAAWLVAGCEKPPMPTPEAPEVTVAYPVQRTVTDYAYFTGTTKGSEIVDIRARVQGFLEEVKFKPTTMVKKDDELFVIQEDEFLAALNQAKGEFQAAEATLINAQTQLDQANAANAQFNGAVSESEVAKLTADRDAADAAKNQAKALIAQRELDLGYTVIRSPIDGLVGRERVDVGNLVGSSGDTLLATVVKLAPMHVEFEVDEESVRRILDKYAYLWVEDSDEEKPPEGAAEETPNDKTERLPVYLARAKDEGYSYVGWVDYIDNQINPETGKAEARAVFPNKEYRLYSGMFVYLRVPQDAQPGAILVREAAIQTDMTGKFVLVVGENDMVEKRRVEPGSLLGGMRVIRSGLSAGERYVVEGVLKARPGMPVKPQLVDDSGIDLGQYEVSKPPADAPEEPPASETKPSPKAAPSGGPAKSAPTPASAPPG